MNLNFRGTWGGKLDKTIFSEDNKGNLTKNSVMEEVPSNYQEKTLLATEVHMCINARSTLFAIYKVNIKLQRGKLIYVSPIHDEVMTIIEHLQVWNSF